MKTADRYEVEKFPKILSQAFNILFEVSHQPCLRQSKHMEENVVCFKTNIQHMVVSE